MEEGPGVASPAFHKPIYPDRSSMRKDIEKKKRMDVCHQLATGWIKSRGRLLVKEEKERNGGTVGFGEFIAVGGSISYML